MKKAVLGNSLGNITKKYVDNPRLKIYHVTATIIAILRRAK